MEVYDEDNLLFVNGCENPNIAKEISGVTPNRYCNFRR